MPAVETLRIRLRQWAIVNCPDWLHPTLRRIEFEAIALAGVMLRLLPGTSRLIGPPRRIAPTLQGHAQARPGDCTYTELYPRSQIRRAPPFRLEPGLHPSFARELSHTSRSVGVGIVRRGRVLTSMGAVVTQDDTLIFDVSQTSAHADPRKHPIFSELKLPPVRRFEGRLALLTMYMSNVLGHYYYAHWMLDTLPRLHLLEKSGIAWDKLVAPQATRFQKETLRLLGIDESRLVAERDLHLEPDQLIVPSLPDGVGNTPVWACDFLRNRFLPHAAPNAAAARRLYVSRQKAKFRRLANEHELLKALAVHGFERIFLEELPLVEQIRLFNEAAVIVAPHGSGLTNLVFCRPGTAVIEIFSPHYVNACWYALADAVKLDYGYVLGRGGAGGGPRIHEDILVDVPNVMRMLDRMLARAHAPQ